MEMLWISKELIWCIKRTFNLDKYFERNFVLGAGRNISRGLIRSHYFLVGAKNYFFIKVSILRRGIPSNLYLARI